MSANKDHERAVALFDYALTQPDDFAMFDALMALDMTRAQFCRAVSDIRKVAAENNYTMVCRRGRFNQHRYRLVQRYAEMVEWVQGRQGSIGAQLETVEGALSVAVNNSDGRTGDGRRARRSLRLVSFLREELQDMDAVDA
jgi:hypothetical protein